MDIFFVAAGPRYVHPECPRASASLDSHFAAAHLCLLPCCVRFLPASSPPASRPKLTRYPPARCGCTRSSMTASASSSASQTQRVFGAAALRARDDAFPLSLGRGLGHRPDHLLVRYSSPSKTLESLNTGWTFCPTFWNHMRNAIANLSRDPNMDFEDIWCAPRNGAGPPPNRAFPGAASTRDKDRICKRPITPRPSPRRPAGV